MKTIICSRLFLIFVQFSFFIVYLSGCGFHLRGNADFDFSLLHIQSESADEIAKELKQRLQDKGVVMVPNANLAQAVVYLRNEKVDTRVLTISSTSGRLEEFELNYHVEMEVRKPDDTVLIEKQVFSLLRDHLFDETAVLAMGTEEEVLRQDMFRDTVEQIIRRLQMLKLGKIAVTDIAFKGLKSHYAIGDAYSVDLVEKSTRNHPVDIWLMISVGKKTWFVTSSEDKAQPWQIHEDPKAWRRDVSPTETRHRLFDLTVQPHWAGEYVLRAVYTAAGTDFDLKEKATTLRSNIVDASIVFDKGRF
jgi:LPS-assembly lipoprotein